MCMNIHFFSQTTKGKKKMAASARATIPDINIININFIGYKLRHPNRAVQRNQVVRVTSDVTLFEGRDVSQTLHYQRYISLEKIKNAFFSADNRAFFPYGNRLTVFSTRTYDHFLWQEIIDMLIADPRILSDFTIKRLKITLIYPEEETFGGDGPVFVHQLADLLRQVSDMYGITFIVIKKTVREGRNDVVIYNRIDPPSPMEQQKMAF